MPYKGKHRGTGKPRRYATKVAKTAAVTGAVAAVPAIGFSSPANAATEDTWDALAQCESSGDWSINTGNGFYGGLQFHPDTWAGFGGTDYASSAHLATKYQQIAIAEKVLEVQGWGAWPACSAELGLGESDMSGSAGSPEPTSDESSDDEESEQSEERSEAASQPSRSSERTSPSNRVEADGATYVVKAGDTLSKIASAQGVAGGWSTLADLNDSLLGGNPDLIYPGEKLTLS